MYQTGPERMLILSIPLVLSEVLCACDIPAEFLSVTDTIPTSLIDNYYDKICNCIKYACRLTIPHSVKKCSSDFSVAGWNDVVKDKHYDARSAFYRAIRCKRGLCCHSVSVCLSVCPSVRLSRSRITSKRIKISSKFFHLG